jgi:Ni/Fe-hydrogenase subunit HybB-like protein
MFMSQPIGHRGFVPSRLELPIKLLAIVVGLGIVGFFGYLLITDQFVNLLSFFRNSMGILSQFILRIVLPLVLIIGIGTALERRVEFGSGTFNLVRSLTVLIALAEVVIVLYAWGTAQFDNLLGSLGGVLTFISLFLLRFVLLFVPVAGIAWWLNRRRHPNENQSRMERPLNSPEERLPLSVPQSVWARGLFPSLSSRSILTLTFVTALWTAALGTALGRFFLGLSSVTNLNDSYPWGIWISFDVVCGVGLAAGGFVIAGTVHVFNLKRFHPILRPAILTAFLGYLLVIVGLLFDLGRWYNVWHAIIMWNVSSPMLEVAWCVMLYSTVLALEFSPIVLEKFKLNRLLKWVRAITIPLVIAGICLSTLHQSTLGTLFLVVPEKMNPLWYSPLLPVFFFISAVAVGLGMTIVESNLSARYLGQHLEDDLMASLGRAAAVVIVIYLALRGLDLVVRGAVGYLFAPGLHSTLFWIEIIVGFVTPLCIFAIKRYRERPRWLFAASGLLVAGFVMDRFDTALLGWWNYTNGGPIYIPSLGELIVTIALVTLGVVAFGLAAKFLPVFVHESHIQAPAE